jgi:argininosuccinate synthase
MIERRNKEWKNMKDFKKIRSVEDLQAVIHPQSRVLTLFSGGLDSAYLLYLLTKLNCTQITALTVDLGDDVDYAGIEKLAQFFGVNSVILDCKQEFAEHHVAPAIAAKSLYLGVHPISSSLSRPLIAKQAVNLARELNCDVILHTANQSQNSLRRLNGAIEQLEFDGYYGTPYEFSAVTREEKARDLQSFGVDVFKTRNYSGDSNLWCREFESGLLDDPENFSTPESLYRWSASVPTAPATELAIQFEKGLPVAVDGVRMDLLALIEHLNKVYGAYGLGRYAGLEHLKGGEKVLEVREMPAAEILLHTYRQLETACIDAETIREKLGIEQVWVREAIEGRWYETLKEASESFILSVAGHVSGTVVYHLEWRTCEIISIRADAPLYLRDRDDWEKKVASLGRTQLAGAVL